MSEKELSILIKAKNLASGAIGQVAKDLGKLDKSGQIVGRGMKSAWQNTQKMALGIAGLAVGAGVTALKWAGDFEAQLNTINTIARATPEGLAKIGDSIRAIARDTGTPLEELTQGYYDLLSAGVKAADAPRVLAEANKLAIGGLSTAAEGVNLLTTAINVYGGDASQAGRFTDEFAKAVERGKVTVAEIAASYAGAAPLAASLGIENKELAAGYARLTAAGTPAAEASTQMAAAMTALLKKAPALEKLEKQTKKNYAAIAGNQGLAEAFNQARTDADKYGIELIDLVGRKEALLYILQTTGPNMEAYNADLEAMGNSAGTAAGQMDERQKGLNFQLARIKALAKDAGITIGSALLPKLTPLVEKFAAFLALDTTQANIATFAEDLAGGIEEAAKFVGSVDWNSVGQGLKIGSEGAKLLIGAFLSAPPWLQGFLATGFVANKFTGGMVTGIIGELGKGLIKGVLGMNAGVVNINAGVVNGGGGVPGGGPSGGGKFGFLGSALKVTVIGAVAIAGLEAGASLVGLNDPRHQTGKPPGKFGSSTFRGTNVASEQIANLERGIPQLTARAKGGDTLAAKQLESVRAEIRRLRDTITVSGRPRTGGRSPDERNAPREAGEAAVLTRATAAGFKPTADQITRTWNATVARQEAAAARQAMTTVMGFVRAQATAADRIVAAIGGISIAPPIVNVTARSVTNNVTRWSRINNRPPRSGPQID